MRNWRRFIAIVFAVGCICFAIYLGAYKTLDQAEKQAEAGFSAVEDVITKRLDILKGLYALSVRNIPADTSTIALNDALGAVENSKSKEDILMAYQNLVSVEQGILEVLSTTDNINEKDARLLPGIKSNLNSLERQFLQEKETYNNGFNKAIDIYSKIFIRTLLKNPKEGLIQ